MSRKQHNKPSEPFGYIVFHRDGNASQVINRQPTKDALELEIGRRFAAGLAGVQNRTYIAKQLPQDDHDFMLTDGDSNEVILQLAELSRWDIASPAEAKFYQRVTPGTPLIADSFVDASRNAEIRAGALLKVIQRKLDKQYARPKDTPLWLVIWSTASDYAPFYISGGYHQVSIAVKKARDYLDVREGGANPFSEVWYFDPNVKPKRIWPLE